MSILKGFRGKDFLEQITLLNDIAANRPAEVLSDLLELFAVPLSDTSVDSMVVIALNALLAENEPYAVQCLENDDPKLRLLCIRSSGEHRFASAVAPLSRLAQETDDADLVLDCLTALARIGDEAALPAFRKHLSSTDPLVAGLSIEMCGHFKDVSALPWLKEVVRRSLTGDRYQTCDVPTWKAIQALGDLGTEDAIQFLASHLHHKNPIARRLITDVMVDLGEKSIPALLDALHSKDEDVRILAANVVGFTGLRSGGNGLVTAFDRGHADTPNVRYAFYEAMGRIGTMKNLVCLMDGLNEADELLLMAVVGGLEHHSNPGIIRNLSERLHRNDDQTARLAKAVINSKAVNIFSALHGDAVAARALMVHLLPSGDEEILQTFREALKKIGTERAATDLLHLAQAAAGRSSGHRALAVDDSRSMLALHRALLTELGFEVLLASNGQEALELLQEQGPVDLVVTDMNMPVMDGMQLVEQLRDDPDMEAATIVMVTTEKEASQRGLAENAGVNAFITKPFRPEQLKEMLMGLLGL
ncbi:MAG: HEAT repeat domain-containing protein [Desulfovibrio sp.]